MDRINLIPMINRDSSIPELIEFIRYSFRECEFAEVQNILVNRENSRKVEIENLVKDVDSLKVVVDALECTQSITVLEKCSLEEKLKTVQRRGEELDKMMVEKGEMVEKLESEKSNLEKKLVLSSRKCKEMDEIFVKMAKIEKLDKMIVEQGEMIEKLESEKLDLEKKLVLSSRKCEEIDEILVKMENKEKLDKMRAAELDKLIVEKREKIEKLESEKSDLKEKLVLSSRKCDEMDERLVKMEKELEELRRENDCANKSIEELKAKEIESDRAVQELKRENVDALHTINELRAKRMAYKDLNMRISKSETMLAEILGVNVKDLASLANAFENGAAAATKRVVMSLEVPAVPGVRDLLHSRMEEDDANMVCTNPGSEPASSNSDVAGNTATVPDNQGREPVVRGSRTSVMQLDGEVAIEKAAVPSSSAAAAGNVVIVISDSDNDDENTLSKKRYKRERGEDSTINCSRKRRRSNSTQPSGLPSSTNVEERQMCRNDTGDLVESEDESCSDDHMNNLIAKLKSQGQSK